MKAKGKKLVSLFLVFSLVTINCASLRTTGGKREKHGATLLITKKDGQQVQGELITVKPNSLLLLNTEGKDVSVGIEEIKVITIVGKSKFWTGAGLGFLAGAAVGALVGSEEASDLHYGSYYYFVPWVLALIYVTIGGLTCGIIGGLIGASVEKDKTIQIEGMTDSEIQEALDKLRKKARIRDYK